MSPEMVFLPFPQGRNTRREEFEEKSKLIWRGQLARIPGSQLFSQARRNVERKEDHHGACYMRSHAAYP